MPPLFNDCIDPKEFVLIEHNLDVRKKINEFREHGIYRCREDEGAEEMCRVLRAPVDTIPDEHRNMFDANAFFIPGSKLFITINYSSVRIGQVVLKKASSVPAGTFPTPGHQIYLNYYYHLLVSKNGVYIVNGLPTKGINSYRDYPLTEIRLEFPIWIYPNTTKGNVP